MKITTSGIEEITNQMAQMQQLTGDAAKAVLRAGGNELHREWVRTIDRLRHVDTGDMIGSVSATNPKEVGGELEISVYPQGRGRRGVKNATKTYVLHHGRDGKGGIKADHMVETIVEKGTPNAEMAMADTWEQFLMTGKVPAVKKLRKGQK